MKLLAASFFLLTVAVAFLPGGHAQGATGAGPKADTVALTRALDDANEDVRRQAAEALVKCGAKAVPDLLEVLGHKKQGVRLLVMEVLGKIGPAAEMAAPLLGRMLHEGDDSDSSEAGSALAKIGPAAVPVIRELAGHKVERTRDRALAALASISGDSEKVVPVLADLLENKDVAIRRNATIALFRMTTEPIAPVLRALQDDDALVRAHARNAMANSKRRGSSEWTKALHTFWQRGLKNKTVLPWLIKALKKDGYRNVQCYAVYAIANLGADARDAIPELEAITDPDMQIHIRFGLQRIRGKGKR
jgi:HEAT repeat protein